MKFRPVFGEEELEHISEFYMAPATSRIELGRKDPLFSLEGSGKLQSRTPDSICTSDVMNFDLKRQPSL